MQKCEDFCVNQMPAIEDEPSVQQRGISENCREGGAYKMDEQSRLALEKADEKLKALQLREKAQTFAATVFSSAISSVMRREYLCGCENLSVRANYDENIPQGEIKWLQLIEVGVQDDFDSAKAASALECVFSAFHLPEMTRLLFLVSSDATDDGEKVTIHLGLQSIGDRSDKVKNMPAVMSGFSQSVWPGLSFKEAAEINLFKNPPRRPGVRIVTGIPAGRSEDKCDATIDKLAAALRGRSWRYLVVADPVGSSEVDAAIHVCGELAGKAESLKTFQVSDSFSKAVSESWSHADGVSDSESRRQLGAGRAIGVATIAGVGIAAASCAALATVAPALMPAFVASAPVWLLSAGKVLASSGVLMPLSLVGGALLSGAKTKSEVKSATDTMSKSITGSESYSFSRSIVNKHAEATVKLIEEQIKRLQLCSGIGAWEVGAYLIGEDDATADIGANVLKSLISGDDSYQEPVRIHNPGRPVGPENPLVALLRFANPCIVPVCGDGKIDHPLGERFGNLRTVVNTRELTRFINLPLSNIPGVPVRRIAADTGLRSPDSLNCSSNIVLGNQICRGQELNKYPYSFDRAMLAKHALVCGINGSGKTNTILGILGKLHAEASAPFLVIEPAKQEYVAWAVAKNKELVKRYKGDVNAAKKDERWIKVYIPGRTRWGDGDDDELPVLRLNPFDFVWLNPRQEPKTLEHIDRLKTVINAALPMQEILPVLMEELIYMVYEFKGCPVAGKYPCWLPQAHNERFPRFDEKLLLPSFTRMAMKIEKLFATRTYAKDVQKNLRAALVTRVDSFKRGWRKELLNKASPRNSREDWESLFEHPTVINLTSLASDEDKAFFMALLLLFIYEYRQECSELPGDLKKQTGRKNADKSQRDEKLRHLLVIEEAHRILGRTEAASSFSANPKQKVSEMFSNMISEVRAYGQGILIADQIPCRLNEDAVKNTNLKIVHRLVSADDRAAMATALNLWDDQGRVIGDLGVGEVLVRGDMDKQTVMVKVNEVKEKAKV